MERRLRLVVLMPLNVSNGRGVPRFVINMFRFFPREHFDLFLVQSSWTDSVRLAREDYEEFINENNSLTFKDHYNCLNFLMKNRITILLLFFLLKPVAVYLNSIFLEREVKNKIKSADLVYVTANYYRALARFNKNQIGSGHNLFFWNGLLGKLYSFLTSKGVLNRFPYIHIFPNQERYFSRYRGKKIIIPLGIDTFSFLPKNNSSGLIKLLFVGALDRSKGLDILLEAYRDLKHPPYELHIVGKGSLEGEVQERESLGIFYHGPLSEDKLAEIYSGCDILILPTRSDIYSTVILEALSSGLFVITSSLLRGTFDVYEQAGFLKYCDLSSECLLKGISTFSSKKHDYNVRENIHNMVRDNNEAREIFRKLSESIYESYYSTHRDGD
ncbi:MAG: glycosyltransferase family 4 protein [Nitrososphaerota archaeon]